MSSPGLTKQMLFGQVNYIKNYFQKNYSTLKVDQPAGAGFSSGAYDYNEDGVQEDFHAFLTEFYKQLPQYKKNPLFITGEQSNSWS